MGISSNQARFLALTSRQVDLEFRIQQICQRRLRLSSELENVATSYNNSISNRQLFTMNTTNSGITQLSISGTNGIETMKDTNNLNYKALVADTANPGQYVGILDSDITAIKGGTAYQGISLATLGLTSSASTSDIIEAAVRSGLLNIAKQADVFTQSPQTVTSSTTKYELQDWRTLPNVADELKSSDDVTAENKYDNTVTDINAQDKKLQLEQTSIEVEYKAVTSEKDAVKKVLDTNATASFKYFS